MKEVYDFLKDNNISYEVVTHPAVLTTEEADKYVEGKEGVLTKTIFMSGKKNRKFYMFIMDDRKRLDIKKMSELVSDKLSFAREEYLESKLGLKPGCVSLFGLINNVDHDVNVYIDEDIVDERIITFHPNINTETLFIKMSDMFKTLDVLKYEYKVIKF